MNRKSHKVSPSGAQLGHPSRRRDTAEACRDKAKDNLFLALRMPSGRQRLLLERSAAAWATRAAQLQREDTRVAVELPTPDQEAEHVRL
jgi:hypothetical protein